MPEIVTRAEARERGLKRYFTLKPCRHGHVSERLTAKNDCHECTLERHRRDYRKNIEKNRADGRKRHTENRERYNASCRERMKKYLAANPEKYRERSRKWRSKNTEKCNEKDKKRKQKIYDLLAVLRVEMPELMKEFGL